MAPNYLAGKMPRFRPMNEVTSRLARERAERKTFSLLLAICFVCLLGIMLVSSLHS